MLYGLYEEYLKEYECLKEYGYEMGSIKEAMTYERWKEFYEVDETMSSEELNEILSEIFWC